MGYQCSVAADAAPFIVGAAFFLGAAVMLVFTRLSERRSGR